MILTKTTDPPVSDLYLSIHEEKTGIWEQVCREQKIPG